MANNEYDFRPDDFVFVQQDKVIKDKKLETKPTTFFKDAMRRAGIPYTHYKENSLFKSRECKEWVAIFNALCAPDFSYWNRRLLSEALITDFFHFDVDGLDKLRYIESDVFDRPDNKCRIRIYEWRMLALKHRYAEMMERVYKDSEIEKRYTKEVIM